MLELRKSCENCNCELLPNNTDAMICSYECTFCKSCVDTVLFNVCPNCGGGFCKRPIRPKTNLKNGNYLENNPPVDKLVYKPVDTNEHSVFSSAIKDIPPNER